MTMQPLKLRKSSNVESVAYDDASRVLVVRFSSGMAYSYADVQARTVAELQRAKSAGSALNKLVVKVKKATKLEELPALAPHDWSCVSTPGVVDMDCEHCATQERARLRAMQATVPEKP